MRGLCPRLERATIGPMGPLHFEVRSQRVSDQVVRFAWYSATRTLGVGSCFLVIASVSRPESLPANELLSLWGNSGRPTMSRVPAV